MRLKNKKKLAAKILKIGKSRVWIDPERTEGVETAITREDIRRLIHEKVIQARPKQGVSRSRARISDAKKKKGRRRGEGRRKGHKTSKISSKRMWMTKVRLQRKKLKNWRETRVISSDVYRRLYGMIKGGAFADASHLDEHVKTHKLIKRR